MYGEEALEGGLRALRFALVRRAEVPAGLFSDPRRRRSVRLRAHWDFCSCASAGRCDPGRPNPTERLPRCGKPEQSRHLGLAWLKKALSLYVLLCPLEE